MQLRDRLAQRERDGLLRTLTEDEAGDGFIDLGTNDYLGLSRHPGVIERVRAGASKYGIGAGASRVLAQHTALQREAERRFVAYKRGAGTTDRALLLPSGFAANMAVLGAVVRSGDLILLDKLAHASLIDGARLACATVDGVRMRTFTHNDVARAREIAGRHLERHPSASVLLVSEMVFSMDGDLCPIEALVALRDELEGSGDGGGCLVIDEAHSTGVLDTGIARGADVVVSTASKALGTIGGIVCGNADVISAIVNFSRVFVYSTSAPPTLAAGILGALEVMEQEPERAERLATISRRVRGALREAGWCVHTYAEHPTPIVPLICGSSENSVGLAGLLREKGILAPAIRPPSVPTGTARVRMSLRADLTDDEVDRVLGAVTAGDAIGLQQGG